jgi:hypothetical protein
LCGNDTLSFTRLQEMLELTGDGRIALDAYAKFLRDLLGGL